MFPSTSLKAALVALLPLLATAAPALPGHPASDLAARAVNGTSAASVGEWKCVNLTHYFDPGLKDARLCPPGVPCSSTKSFTYAPCGVADAGGPSSKSSSSSNKLSSPIGSTVPEDTHSCDDGSSVGHTGNAVNGSVGSAAATLLSRPGGAIAGATTLKNLVKADSAAPVIGPVATKTGNGVVAAAAQTSSSFNSTNLNTVITERNVTAGAGKAKAIQGKVAGAWISPWDKWDDTDYNGITDIFVGFVDMSSGANDAGLPSFTGLLKGQHTITNDALAALKKKHSSIQRVWASFGGWASPMAFQAHVGSADGRKNFAKAVKTFMDTNSAFNGIDMDWEYPGGNGVNYKQHPNDPTEKEDNVLLMEEILTANPDTYISVAVPGRAEDKKVSYDKAAITKLDPLVSMWNVMTYDLCNRRDTKFTHQASYDNAAAALKRYVDDGVPKDKLAFGFPMYAKVFPVDGTPSDKTPAGLLNTPLKVMEDAKGEDNGDSATIRFNSVGNKNAFGNPDAQSKLDNTWSPALFTAIKSENDHYDEKAVANAYFDGQYIYSWQSAKAIEKSCGQLKADGYKGGFAYAGGQDDPANPARWNAFLKCVV